MEKLIGLGLDEEEFIASLNEQEESEEVTPEEKPEETPEEKPEEAPEEKPEEAPEEKPEEAPEEKPEESNMRDLDKELEELDKLLGNIGEDLADAPTNTEGDNTELTDKLTKAAKEINSLQAKIADYQLKEAEAAKFGGNYDLDPEIIIIKANYDKAKKGDEVAKNKIKELMLTDLGLSLQNNKDVFVSNSITSKPNVNVDMVDDGMFGIIG